MKSLQLHVGFLNIHRQYLPNLAEKLIPLHGLLQKDVKFLMTNSVWYSICETKVKLAKSGGNTLRLASPKKRLVIFCDGSEHAAGYVLLTEDYTDTVEGTHKFYTPAALGSRQYTAGRMSLNMYAKEFLAMHLAFDELGHILCEVKKPTVVMTINMALSWLFRAKRNSGFFANKRFSFSLVQLTYR